MQIYLEKIMFEKKGFYIKKILSKLVTKLNTVTL